MEVIYNNSPRAKNYPKGVALVYLTVSLSLEDHLAIRRLNINFSATCRAAIRQAIAQADGIPDPAISHPLSISVSGPYRVPQKVQDLLSEF
jgi:hypothetical protein